MKLTVFQSDKGDCLMLTTGGKRMLIDGGMRKSYTRHVASTMSKLRGDGEKLDLVYVSHIDRDHVWGVLQMMEDLVAWRVYDFHQTSDNGNRAWPKPKVRRPPEIGGIWHNVFHELVGKNAGPIGDMLAANARVLSGSRDVDLTELAEIHQNLTSSMADAVQLTRRLGSRQLGIPVNKEFDGKLILQRENQAPVRFGGANIHVIGPSGAELKKLRREWNDWLKSASGARQIQKIRRKHRRDEDIFELTNIGDLLVLRRSRAEELGRRSKVTQPNLASLMLLVEKGGKTILLTGDGHSKDILTGLQEAGKLQPGAGIHLDVLKVQHHGSENNIEPGFCKRVTADHYVFCGNGAHENPDLRVIDACANSRTGTARQRSNNPEASKSCTFWFNSSSAYPRGNQGNRDHMRKIERKMRKIEQRSSGRIKSRFLKTDKFEFAI